MTDEAYPGQAADDALREAIRAWFEHFYPQAPVQHFIVYAAGQTIEQAIGNGEQVGGEHSWLVARGQPVYVSLGILRAMQIDLEAADVEPQ